jgi:hypothetical protein
MPSADRYAPDDWTLDAPKITEPEQMERVRTELARGPILLKHWHYRGARCPTLQTFDDYDKFTEYLSTEARPGDAFDAWPLTELCSGLGTLAAGKYPDTDGAVPRKGAY